jgi:hypothetical protein
MNINEITKPPQVGGSALNVELDGWIGDVILDVAELPDRTSPDNFPDAMLVTGAELREIIESRAPQYLRAQVAPGIWAYVRRQKTPNAKLTGRGPES